MPDETTRSYKYVILRDRDGKYLIPYSGAHGLADVAFTGRYQDLLDTPPEGSFLPAETFGNDTYYVSKTTVFSGNEPVSLEACNDFLDIDSETGEHDFAIGSYAVNEEYVSNISKYIIDSIKGIVDEVSTNSDSEQQSGEDEGSDIITVFRGFVEDVSGNNGLPQANTANIGDIYYVNSQSRWYICVYDQTSETNVWSDTHNGGPVTP